MYSGYNQIKDDVDIIQINFLQKLYVIDVFIEQSAVLWRFWKKF